MVKNRKSKRLAAKKACEETYPPLSSLSLDPGRDNKVNETLDINDTSCPPTSSDAQVPETPKKDPIVIVPETEATPPFQPLDQNVYLFNNRRSSRSKKDMRRMVCDCILTKEERHRGVIGCTDDCLNRMLLVECGSRCPLGDNCANKRFQKRHYSKIEPFRAGDKGWGLRALSRISK